MNTKLALKRNKYYIRQKPQFDVTGEDVRVVNVATIDHHYYTAQQLAKRVQDDCRLLFLSWHLDIEDIWQTIHLRSFPNDSRVKIAECILGCAIDSEDPWADGNEIFLDTKSIQRFYRALPFKHPAHRKYLDAILRREIKASYGGFTLHHGSKHADFEKAFIEKEAVRVRNRESRGRYIDLVQWRQSINERYQKLYQKEFKADQFKLDKEEQADLMRNIMRCTDEYPADRGNILGDLSDVLN